MKMLRILVADDHEVVRQGVRGLLSNRPGWEVCGEAINGRDAVTKATALRPDVVVLDVTMPELSGLDAAREIHHALPHCEILMLSVHESEQLVREVLATGARGYVLKSDAGRDLVEAVATLAEHKPFVTARVSQLLLETLHPSGDAAAPQRHLTPREREVVRLVAQGKSSKEIAAELGISALTVETHRTNLMHKLELRSVADLVRYAIRNKLIDA